MSTYLTSGSAGKNESLIRDLFHFSLSESLPDTTTQSTLLTRRQELTDALLEDPYSLHLYQTRSHVYDLLGYSDLAAADAYKALLLIDEVTDESGEYHEVAVESLSNYIATLPLSIRKKQASSSQEVLADLETANSDKVEVHEPETLLWATEVFGTAAPLALAHHLVSIGCLRTACEYAQNTVKAHPTHADAHKELSRIHEFARAHFASNQVPFDPSDFDLQTLPDQGHVRREVYPWNTHEADRNSTAALALLNTAMRDVAPKLEVRVTELPNLARDNGDESNTTVKQLGVFARQNIPPGEEILRERSLLTANSTLHEPLCDACSSVLPSLKNTKATDNSNTDRPIPCPDCADTIFCSTTCLTLAQESYHPAICNVDDIDTLCKASVPAAEAATAMYTLLVLRAFAMSLTQEKHPLELTEVRYIWGDFVTPSSSSSSSSSIQPARTLPFTFSSHILTPLHVLTLLDMDIFKPPASALSELWVVNTLFAKFRATASARMEPRTGRPEVAAVHPLWCLANHSCDPNVTWEWAGEVKFVSRKGRVAWGGKERKESEEGVMIAKDEEILNHYVDVDLPVGERREWGAGALGGMCMCERCVWEAAQEEEKAM